MDNWHTVNRCSIAVGLNTRRALNLFDRCSTLLVTTFFLSSTTHSKFKSDTFTSESLPKTTPFFRHNYKKEFQTCLSTFDPACDILEPITIGHARISVGPETRSSIVEYMHIQDLLCSWWYGCSLVCVTWWTTPEILGIAGDGLPDIRPVTPSSVLRQPPPRQLPTPFRPDLDRTLPNNVLSIRIPSFPIPGSSRWWRDATACVPIGHIEPVTIYPPAIAVTFQSGCVPDFAAADHA